MSRLENRRSVRRLACGAKRRFLMPMLLLVLTAVAGCAATPSTDGPPKIIIYTDFQCGACGRLNSEVEPELISRYVATGQAQLEIRLLASVSPDSMLAAEAALCAGDQDRFLEYQDALFRAYRGSGEDPEIFSMDQLVALAAALGLDATAFRSCLEGGSKEAEVKKNMDLARADNVNTLPTVVVGSARVEGYRPLDVYVDIINVALEDN